MAALDWLLDEVALEGLDGITFSTLWFRLDNCLPPCPLLLDAATKQFVWEALAACPQLRFFQLPRDRPFLVFHDRYEEIDPETGIQETRRDPTPRDDIYPVCIVSDSKHGIQGSCQYFHKRKDITAEIRTQQYVPCCTLQEAVQRWGEKLVIVANQMVRRRALIGLDSDPELSLPDYSYCILERLGRARWQGELQRDLHSGAFKVDARKMHYHRRVLDQNNLITLQSHVIRQPNGNQQYSILLLLKRFHVDRRSKYDILMEKISNILVNRPKQLEVMLTLREELGLCERTFKKLYQYMVAAGIAKVITVPLKDLNPERGPCLTKKGTQIIVRCLKLVKPYGKKVDDEDDDDEDNKTVERMDVVYERDMLTQAYELIEKRGTRGISQTEIRLALNVGKLEGRMLCRLLERYKVITGFMEDEGRQRTTKYVAKSFVKQSELSKQFEKEKARSEQLATTSFLPFDHAKSEHVRQQALAKNLAESKSMPEGLPEGLLKANHGRKEPVKLPTIPAQNSQSSHSEYREKKCTTSQKIHKGKKLVKSALFRKFKLKKGHKSKLSKGRKLSGSVKTTVGMDRSRNIAKHAAESSIESQQIDIQSNSSQENPGRTSCTKSVHGQIEENVVIEEVTVEKAKEKGEGRKRQPFKNTHLKRPHETFRMLKRQNLILEAVRNLKLIESLFSLQKMIMEEERQDGVATRCCKKSIVRMVQKLSQEGLLRLFRTTVVQDGISKKVEFVAHPSVLPNDPLVKSAIEQVRFRISSSYTVHRMKVLELHAQKEREKQTKENTPSVSPSGSEQKRNAEIANKCSTSKTDEKMGVTPLKNYRPLIVPGLGRSLGFLPKMPRLRLVHMFLWYIVYGHPLQRACEEAAESEPSTSDPQDGTKEALAADAALEAAVPSTSNESTNVNTSGNKAAANGTPGRSSTTVEIGGACQWAGDIEYLHVKETVYVDEVSWKRYTPPTPIHREFGHGWALVSDILLCVPLSIFVQIVQVSHKVENVDVFLSDPYMKHSLVRDLPQPMRQQLLYKRRYIFSIFESLQRLCYMGLLQFGPTEKFQEKDQIFVYIKRNAMIVDTTTCDPHYNLAKSSRPFENRCYALNTLQDVESLWFDLMCVCLNTPLGVIRFPRLSRTGQAAQEATANPALNSVMEQEATVKYTLEQKCSLLEHTTGSRTLVDDGKLPGDGLGAAGLDSSFFGHLKRNWIWTSYIMNNAKKSLSLPESSSVRLQSFLNKHSLPLGIAGNKFSMLRVLRSMHESLADKEEIQIEKECNVGRNERVAGGKGQKRKRAEKESGKKQRKKRKKEDLPQPEKAKRFRVQDDADRSALRRMTKLRVTWTAQEDSLLMLCRVASHILNKKVKGPFVPWQAVRDVMHDYLEVALDKTSLAVGRRSRYILKNPQTMLNYRICLAEVHEDHALINEIMNKKNNYQDSKVCAEEFKEFVGRLRQKFTSAIGSGNIEIPDTLQELFARFKILVVGEEGNESQKQDNIKSTDDIHYLVLQNFIQSTLALSDTQMKSCQSFQTFHLYKQYKDEVLVKVFLEFQQRSLVNRRRVSKALGPKKSRALPFAPMSYQLSQAYYRNFMWRFPSNICSESYNFVQKLKNAGKADLPNTFSFQDKETFVGTEMVTYPLDGKGGYCVATISLFILGLLSFHVSIPEQIVVVDSTLVDNEVIKRLGKEGIDDYVDDELEETGNKPRFEVKAPQASHTNYLLMRGYYAPGIVSTRNLNPNDNIVVNSCQVKLKVRSTPAHGCLSTHDGSATLSQAASGPDALPCSFTKVLRPTTDVYVGENVKKQLVEELGYSPEDMAAMQEIAGEVEACSSFGVETVELGKKCVRYEEVLKGRTRTLKQYLQDLIALDQMVEVGGSTERLVAVTHAYPWLLHPFRVCKSTTNTGSPTDVAPKGRTESSAENVEESTEDIEGEQDDTNPDSSTAGTEKGSKQRGLGAASGQNVTVPSNNVQTLTGSRKRTIEEIEGEIVDHGPPVKIPRPGDGPSELSCNLREPRGSTVDETKAGSPQLIKSLEGGSGEADAEHGQDEDRNTDGSREVFSSLCDVKDPGFGPAASQPDEQPVGEDGEGQQTFSQHAPAVGGWQSESPPPVHGQVLQEDNPVVGPEEHLQQDRSFQVNKSEDTPKLQEEGDDTVMENVKVESTVQTPFESEYEQISFVCHPWRIIDGSLNKPVCKGMIEAMLYHIMSKPGITEQKLLSYYSAVLQPVIILEMLQALKAIGCIRKRYFTRAKPTSLFSPPTGATEVQSCKLSERLTVFYEPTIDCVLRLGNIFPHEPNWNKWIQ